MCVLSYLECYVFLFAIACSSVYRSRRKVYRYWVGVQYTYIRHCRTPTFIRSSPVA